VGSDPLSGDRTQRVLGALLGHPGRELFGRDITDLAGLRAGTVHPVLARLEGVGWLTSRWEDVEAAVDRPPRRVYRLTAEGAQAARAALVASPRRAVVPRLNPAPGTT
jgi:PadR family transcriptional regulator, regulatory protein PadR